MKSLTLLSLLFLTPCFCAYPVNADDELGVEKSNLLNDLRSRKYNARRTADVKVDISQAERVCIAEDSSLGECQSAIDRADAEITAGIQQKQTKEEESSSESVVVEGSNTSSWKTKWRATSPANRPTVDGKPMRPTHPIHRPRPRPR